MATEETGKSEIAKLPEGMSSEEIDKLTTEEETPDDTELAQEAAAEAEPSPAEESVEDETPAEEAEEEKPKEKPKEEPKPDPKDAVIGDFRRKYRDEQIKAARLEGELQARKEMTTKAESPEKSPLEIAEAAYIAENDTLDGFAMDGALYREQKAFDDKQTAKKTATDRQTQTDGVALQAEAELQQGELSTAKMGDGLDLKTVAALGTQYLTKGDRLDIADMIQTRGSKAALTEAYNIMKRRILASGTEDAKLLQNAIDLKGKSKSQTKPKKTKEKLDIDKLTTEGEEDVEEKGEAETETQSKRLTDFVFSEE